MPGLLQATPTGPYLLPHPQRARRSHLYFTKEANRHTITPCRPHCPRPPWPGTKGQLSDGLTTPPLAQNPITPNCSLKTLRALRLLALPPFCPARVAPAAPAQRTFLPFGPRGAGLPQEAAPEPCRPSWEWMWPAPRRTQVPSHTRAREATYTQGRHAHTSANVHADWLS